MEIPYILKFIYEHSPLFSILFFGIVMAMAAQQSGGSNSRVSRFELMQKDIGYIQKAMERIEEKLDTVTGDHEVRIRGLEKGQRNSGIFQSALALALSSIAAFIGSQK